jgi:hypothetical protein
MNAKKMIILLITLVLIPGGVLFAAYHHMGERDSGKFLDAYPELAGTKLDHCALCHSGGSYENDRGRTITMGSCQWCHYSYGYDGSGDIADTMNQYGIDFKAYGRNVAAVMAIEDLDSDGDGYTNAEEITAGTYPGNANDHPGQTVAPHRVYTLAQLEEIGQHTQFMLMNASRSIDSYVEYTGTPVKDLLGDAGILPNATGIVAYAPDGWAQTHPLEYEATDEMYHVYGNMPGQSYQYPPASYYYSEEADVALNPAYGWCDYNDPSCVGRSNGDPINVDGGLKAILAYKREAEGVYLDPGFLDAENRIDGEGPFRMVVPQKSANPPDQSSRSTEQDVIWPYVYEWDHNAGACTKSTTIIKVEPLPEGTTDIDILEAGWTFVDQNKIIVYGAIDGTDSNGNGILDSEEFESETSDYSGDGIPDYMAPDTARFRHVNGLSKILMHCRKGEFASVATMAEDDPSLTDTDKPEVDFPYGVMKFTVTALNNGASVDVDMVFPEDVPTYAELYLITATGWKSLSFSGNNGDDTIRVKLTEGDAATDGDGSADGAIRNVVALGIPAEAPPPKKSSSSSCFIKTLLK